MIKMKKERKVRNQNKYKTFEQNFRLKKQTY